MMIQIHQHNDMIKANFLHLERNVFQRDYTLDHNKENKCKCNILVFLKTAIKGQIFEVVM